MMNECGSITHATEMQHAAACVIEDDIKQKVVVDKPLRNVLDKRGMATNVKGHECCQAMGHHHTSLARMVILLAF